MKPLRERLYLARQNLEIPWEVLERDYILSWILAGISRVEELQENLIFKGGTALKKCYFGDYRFSEDLDFTALAVAPKGNLLEKTIQEACKRTTRLLDKYVPVEIICERYTEKNPHPEGQEAFTIRTRFPWHRTPQVRVMIEVTLEEKILRTIQQRSILHTYGEPLKATIAVYALEEIIAEKLRAILQHAQKLKERGWSRSRARDYYDLWRILNTYKNQLDFTDFYVLLCEKCAAKNITFEKTEDFFQKNMLVYVEKTWEQWLSPLVPGLPAYKQIIEELKPQIEAIIKF